MPNQHRIFTELTAKLAAAAGLDKDNNKLYGTIMLAMARAPSNEEFISYFSGICQGVAFCKPDQEKEIMGMLETALKSLISRHAVRLPIIRVTQIVKNAVFLG